MPNERAGNTVQLNGMEMCYEAAGGEPLDAATVWRYGAQDSGPPSGQNGNPGLMLHMGV